jgi:hypothetical protein
MASEVFSPQLLEGKYFEATYYPFLTNSRLGPARPPLVPHFLLLVAKVV